MEKFTGSCVCQRVKFEIAGKFKAFYLCHCSRCRKVSGSAHASNVFVKLNQLTWTSGDEFITRYQLEGTQFTKTFCSLCSGALPSIKPGGYALIPAGALDSELHHKPMAHIMGDSRASWDDGFASVQTLPGLPSS